MAINKFGREVQIDMIIEECIELALALQKLKRERGSSVEKFAAVIDEIADVRIMIEQAQILFPADKIKDRIIFKMARLEKRIVEGLP